MIIRSIIHKGLREFVEDGDRSGIDSKTVPKLINIISFLQAMKSPDELYGIKSWHVHQLKGDMKGVWSLSVTRNWRLTFRIDKDAIEVIDLNLIDYH
ncbi:MAG: type II toxin-antitoxin system RelE/ParE family toxin [Candidatus Pacebacteria bacterium]|nr:type II toxin-antitoxin system RelE/ParE family toxin [Candidatus Paceibacterota bacterium]